MRKVFLTMAAVVAIASASFAQTGKNQLGIGPEFALYTGSGGGALFDSETEGSSKVTGTMIPVLAGYRHNFNGLYVEPQAGYMSTKWTWKEDGEKIASGSDGSFAYAIGGGYAFANGLDLGASFRNTAQSGATGMIVFRVGYNFSLGGSK